MKKLLFILSTVVLAVLVPFVCLETWLQISERIPRKEYKDHISPLIYERDKDCLYKLIPNKSYHWQKSEWDVYGHTNPQGFMDDFFELKYSSRPYVIALLGDSFCEGKNIRPGHRFHEILEARLSKRLGFPVQIYNFGVDGIGTIHEWRIYQKKALPYKPDMVLLAAFFTNDYFDNIKPLGANGFDANNFILDLDRHGRLIPASKERAEYFQNTYDTIYSAWVKKFEAPLPDPAKVHLKPEFPKNPIKRFLYKHTRSYRFLRDKMNSIHGLHDWLMKLSFADTKSDDYFKYRQHLFYYDLNHPIFAIAFEITKALLLEIQKDTQKRGIPFAVISIPWIPQLDNAYIRKHWPQYDPQGLETCFQGFMKSSGIDSLSVLDKFQSYPFAIRRLYFRVDDSHLNERGNAVLAKFMEDFLVDRIKRTPPQQKN